MALATKEFQLSEQPDFLRYLITQSKNEDHPQRRAYIGLCRKKAESLALEINAKFVASGCPADSPVFYSQTPLVVYVDEKWPSQELHLLVERPPRYGGPPLTLEVYSDKEAFIRHCPSRHHVDWVSIFEQKNNCKGVLINAGSGT